MGRRSEGYKLKKREESGIWYIHWSEGRRPFRQSTGTRSRAEAEQFYAEFIKGLSKAPAPPEHLYTVSECVDHYIDEHLQGKASLKVAKWSNAPLSSILGDSIAISITPSQITKYVAQRKEKGLSYATIRRELELLRASLYHAVRENRIIKAPAIKLPPPPPAREKYLTRKEAAKLVDAAKQKHIKLFILIALHTGQRKGAILDLTWDRVNFKSGVIDFNPPGRMQTAKKRVPIRMNSVLVSAMKKAQKERKGEYVIEFRGSEGRVDNIRHGFTAARKAAGLPDTVTPHTLRHTCGTWLAQAGVDMWRISGILGHTTSRTTELYAKHDPDYMKDAIEMLATGKQSANNRYKRHQKRPK